MYGPQKNWAVKQESTLCFLKVTIDKIMSRAWDVVILQEYSTRPAYDEDQVCVDTVAPLNSLVKLIKESSPNAIIQVNFLTT